MDGLRVQLVLPEQEVLIVDAADASGSWSPFATVGIVTGILLVGGLIAWKLRN